MGIGDLTDREKRQMLEAIYKDAQVVNIVPSIRAKEAMGCFKNAGYDEVLKAKSDATVIVLLLDKDSVEDTKIKSVLMLLEEIIEATKLYPNEVGSAGDLLLLSNSGLKPFKIRELANRIGRKLIVPREDVTIGSNDGYGVVIDVTPMGTSIVTPGNNNLLTDKTLKFNVPFNVGKQHRQSLPEEERLGRGGLDLLAAAASGATAALPLEVARGAERKVRSIQSRGR